MIDIKRKEDCVGCGACAQRCPVNCISLNVDEQGFAYAKADASRCIQCGLCDKVCPVINQSEPRRPAAVYAAKNTDNSVREASSSGGLFYALAADVIADGGIVFGAKFDADWNVVHSSAESLKELKPMLGSKYVQSHIGDSYLRVEESLKAGRKVMFVGTSCQTAGLRLFLRRDYPELLTVDVVCHGVPSPAVWRSMVSNIECGGKNKITAINFRDKRLGWKQYGMSVRGINDGTEKELVYMPHTENPYMTGFLANLYLRPSCHACPAKKGKSRSDISLADFWGIQKVDPELYSDRGVSLVMAHTDKGVDALKRLSFGFEEVDYETAIRKNKAVEQVSVKSKESALFWRLFSRNGYKAVLLMGRFVAAKGVRRKLLRLRVIAAQILKI